MAGQYLPSKAGWDAIAMSPEIQAACMAVAAEGKAFAESISPRSDDDEGTPYAESFEVNPKAITEGFRFNPRVGAELRNTAPHSPAVEWGNKQRPSADRVIGRTEDFLTGGGA